MHHAIKTTTKVYSFEESNKSPLIKTYLLVNNIPAKKLLKQSKSAKFLDTTTFFDPISPTPTPLPFTDILFYFLTCTHKTREIKTLSKSETLNKIQRQPRICFGSINKCKWCCTSVHVYAMTHILLSLHKRAKTHREEGAKWKDLVTTWHSLYKAPDLLNRPLNQMLQLVTINVLMMLYVLDNINNNVCFFFETITVIFLVLH